MMAQALGLLFASSLCLALPVASITQLQGRPMGPANPAICWGPQLAQSTSSYFVKSGASTSNLFRASGPNLFMFKEAQSQTFYSSH